MSYDISFWKPRPGTSPDPQATYERLSRRGATDDLEPLPVEQVLAKLREAFPGFDPAEEFPDVELPEGNIELSWSEKHFRFDFRGPETGAEKWQVWEVMRGFGCVCYDPQTGTLHTADNPPDYRPLTPDEIKQVEKLFGGRDIASMMKRLERQQSLTPPRRAVVGCFILLLLASLVIAAVATVVVYFVR